MIKKITLTPELCNAVVIKKNGFEWFKEYTKNLPERFETVKDAKKLYEQITGEKVEKPVIKQSINEKI